MAAARRRTGPSPRESDGGYIRPAGVNHSNQAIPSHLIVRHARRVPVDAEPSLLEVNRFATAQTIASQRQAKAHTGHQRSKNGHYRHRPHNDRDRGPPRDPRADRRARAAARDWNALEGLSPTRSTATAPHSWRRTREPQSPPSSSRDTAKRWAISTPSTT